MYADLSCIADVVPFRRYGDQVYSTGAGDPASWEVGTDNSVSIQYVFVCLLYVTSLPIHFINDSPLSSR